MSDAPAEDQKTDDGPDVGDLDARIDDAKDRPTSGEELSEEQKKEMEDEREQRLDPENRPDNVEVDNTDRDFDPVKGQFTDSEEDPDLGPYMDPGEENE